jgi:hypothetical protein
MHKLRGTGTTFSTSGKRWVPWHSNSKVGRRNARLWRLKRKGLLPNLTKAEARALCDQAVAARSPQQPTEV